MKITRTRTGDTEVEVEINGVEFKGSITSPGWEDTGVFILSIKRGKATQVATHEFKNYPERFDFVTFLKTLAEEIERAGKTE